nr:PREDICTED: uncharacterized protein LOC109037688 [Bemisia tabaci]
MRKKHRQSFEVELRRVPSDSGDILRCTGKSVILFSDSSNTHLSAPASAMAFKLALWAFVCAAILGLVLSAPGGETGSWCYKPSREAYWGHASGTCCPGNMGSDRRCYGLRGDSGKCTKFYNCCIHQFGSGNKESDPCN